MIKVSIIIAVYNVEAFLEKCLNSLLGQTLQELEVIAVNDGSTDASGDILNAYAQKDSRLKVFNKQNGGAADARNFGLAHAVGEYVGYVDSDDYVDADMFEVMYNKAKSAGADIVECNLRHTRANGQDIDIEVMPQYFKPGELLCFGRYVVWNKIYRREWMLAAGAAFPVGVIYEDVEFVARLVPYIKNYAYVDIAPVHYVQRLSSVNNTKSAKTLHIFTVLQNIVDFYRQQGFYAAFEAELEYLFARILLLSSFSRMCRIANRQLRKQALRQNWQTLVKAYPHWRKNSILKSQKSKQALFMKTTNAFTYRVYSGVFPAIYWLDEHTSKKWK